jgi:hypothetical protein
VRAQAPASEALPPPPAPSATAAPIPLADATLRAVLDRWVRLRLARGGEAYGRLISFEPTTVTLMVPPSNEVISYYRETIAAVTLADSPERTPAPPSPPPPATPVAAPEPDPYDRHFGLLLGIPPGVTLDVDYQLLYAFADVSVVFPLATSGKWAAMSFGTGINFRLGGGWKFEVFAFYSPMRTDDSWGEWIHGVGAGVGMHYTMRNGFSVGFKVPVVGYSVTSTTHDSSENGVVNFYFSAACGLPLLSLGYRF